MTQTLHRHLLAALLGGHLALGNLTAQVATCASTCTGNLGININPSGDFGSGVPNILPFNPYLAPGYTYTLSPPPNDGLYTITNDTGPWGSFAQSSWIDIKDNGPEQNGYMMVVNASYSPGIFFEQTVPVCENTKYELSIDVVNLVFAARSNDHSPPDISFLIDAKVVCTTGKVPFNERWNTYRFSFTSAPGQNEVKFSINNNAPGGFGNDLAIDNIVFRACGPEIQTSDLSYFCRGEALDLTSLLQNSPYTTTHYQWQYGGQTGLQWQDVPNANTGKLHLPTPKDGDWYRLLTANAPGNLALEYCRSVSDPIQLALDDLSGFAIGGTDTIVCNGAPGVLDAGAFTAYRWSTGEVSDTILAAKPGWYAVTITSQHDCQASDSIFVYESRLTAELEQSNPICFGDATGNLEIFNTQGGTGPLRYSIWPDSSQNTPFFDQLSAGTYRATVFDSLGCTVLFPVQLSNPAPFDIHFEPLRPVYACDTISLRHQTNYEPVRYQWQPTAGLSCTTCPFPVAMPTDTTTYTLTVYDALGCSATDSLRVEVLPNLSVYAPNVFRADAADFRGNAAFRLFPSKSVRSLKRLAIFDRWGTLVFERKNIAPDDPDAAWEGFLPDYKPAPQGVYVWLAEIEFSDGKTRLYEGDVLLLR